ncbi:transporter substrate-binding domain-containing protein [Pantoea ananatis]|uniref:transporter substrate-binding domain-containing protein n=1 Tax=Pantoea ananas TaxID=553 RepID=UPI000B03196D|nr:transporter substrate-binding domain-containing protein [Pantoea ananatis]
MSVRSHVTMALLSVALGVACSAHADTLTAGSPPSSALATFLDTKTGKIEGFMPDVAAEVAKRQHLDVNFTAVPFSTLIQSVLLAKLT